MRRERVLSITLMVTGAFLMVGGVLWLWLGYRATRSEPFSGFNPVWPTGSVFIGLLVGAAGASTHSSE